MKIEKNGWKLISNVIEPLTYNFIYNYITNNNILKKYFTAIPINSYHMTIYDIWCNGRNLIPFQENYLQSNFTINDQEILREQSTQIQGMFNPNGCMDILMDNIKYNLLDRLEADDNAEEENVIQPKEYISVNCSEVKYTGSVLCAIVEGNFSKPNQLREKMYYYLNANDNMICYHINFAYQHRLCNNNEDIQLINTELYILNIIMKNVKFNLSNPFLATFNDMKFTPCFDRLKYCFTYLVPDKHTQLELKKYGFDITAPTISFKHNPTLQEINTKFGGAHISITKPVKYTYNCHKQLKTLVDTFQTQLVFQTQTDKKWSLPISAKIDRSNKFQSKIVFNCPILEKTLMSYIHSGIKIDKFHIGLYSSRLQDTHTVEQESNILNCLLKANWGFILSIDNGDNNFIFDWNTFIGV